MTRATASTWSMEIEKEVWAHKMRVLLRRACHAANLAREHDPSLPPRLIALIERSYDAILTQGFAFHEALPELSGAGRRRGRKARRVGHNLPACCTEVAFGTAGWTDVRSLPLT